MTDLSPAARAVLDAVLQKSNLSPTVPVAAAALRAAASQLTSAKASDQLRAMAAELEGNHLGSPDSSDGPAMSEDREPLIEKARAALVEPESIEDRIAQADVAIEVSMGRIRKIASMPAAQLAAERRAALAIADKLEGGK